MSIDLSKLSPAPWMADNDHGGVIQDQGNGFFRSVPHDHTDAVFIALARNAFDVMMRRGWSVFCHNGKFTAMMPATVPAGKYHAQGSVIVMKDDIDQGYRDDPFTCLIEADRWYLENVEAKGKP